MDEGHHFLYPHPRSKCPVQPLPRPNHRLLQQRHLLLPHRRPLHLLRLQPLLLQLPPLLRVHLVLKIPQLHNRLLHLRRALLLRILLPPHRTPLCPPLLLSNLLNRLHPQRLVCRFHSVTTCFAMLAWIFIRRVLKSALSITLTRRISTPPQRID